MSEIKEIEVWLNNNGYERCEWLVKKANDISLATLILMYKKYFNVTNNFDRPEVWLETQGIKDCILHNGAGVVISKVIQNYIDDLKLKAPKVGTQVEIYDTSYTYVIRNKELIRGCGNLSKESYTVIAIGLELPSPNDDYINDTILKGNTTEELVFIMSDQYEEIF